MLKHLKPFAKKANSFYTTSSTATSKKLVATRKLLKHSQERLEKKGFEIIQWPHDTTMPRDKLLKEVKDADGLICMISDKIDKDVFEAAGKQKKIYIRLSKPKKSN